VTEPAYDILLVGGGIASASAAAELRERGFEGSILLATRELDPPYHRPPITKGYLQGREDRESTLIHPQDWYAEHDVEVRTRAGVMDIDLEARTAKIGREIVGFGKALVATGAGVRRLQAEGGQRDGIHYLRALPNADKLHGALDGAERVVVVGGSYIATEVAASLTVLGKACTVVMQETLPMERHFGPVAGQFVHDVLTSHGIEIVAGADVSAFDGNGEDGPVTAVVCADGRRVEADLVVVGVGATPDVMLAKKAGLELGESGGVKCDRQLRTSAEGIYAAGDMCEFDSVRHGRRLRIEHEEVAAAQGRHVARAMLGSDEPFADVPYFWSDLADWATLEYVGTASAGWDEEIVHGDPADGAFSVWYLQDDTLVAALAVGRTDDVEHAAALIVAGASGERVRGALAEA
jgi:3-phenylpropionate/trans-cinnamate dioxygenase ferredoxin reductase component